MKNGNMQKLPLQNSITSLNITVNVTVEITM